MATTQHPCDLSITPPRKLVFVSDRNAFKASNPGYAPNALAFQLFVMDDPPHPDPVSI